MLLRKGQRLYALNEHRKRVDTHEVQNVRPTDTSVKCYVSLSFSFEYFVLVNHLHVDTCVHSSSLHSPLVFRIPSTASTTLSR